MSVEMIIAHMIVVVALLVLCFLVDWSRSEFSIFVRGVIQFVVGFGTIMFVAILVMCSLFLVLNYHFPLEG